jgi:hypothetical protein
MRVDRRFHFDTADIFAAADDDVLLAVDDEQIAIGVEIAALVAASLFQ